MTGNRAWMIAVIVLWMPACGGETSTPEGEDAPAVEVAADATAEVIPSDLVEAEFIATEIVDLDDGASEDIPGTEPDAAPDVCLPHCDGKECGDDGCGGICGECDDGNICNGVENCIGSLCSKGDSLVCEDDNQCTEDSCDPEAGCLFTNVESACDDGDECTNGDVCHEGVCAGESPWPAVMFLLDTSGSMEASVSEEDLEGVVPTCHDEKQEGFEYDKSRWIVIIEVLTGTFNDYWCSYDMRDDDPDREDYLYSFNPETGQMDFPHVVPHGTEIDGDEQAKDGILDVYTEGIKFGMTAFDTRVFPATDASGGFSYGPDKEFNETPVNLGGRNESAPWGALVAPPVEDTTEAVTATNSTMDQQIGAATPYGGTPIAPMLDDLVFFYGDHDAAKPFDETTGTGDPEYTCRPKAAVLITDGVPNLGEGGFGYSHSHEVAVQLLAAGIDVHFVGFQLPTGAFALGDKIIEAGGTAVEVTDTAEMYGAIESILNEMLGE